MPQIEQLAATYGSQIFWLLITFGFVFLVVGRMMTPKVVATVDKRDEMVATDLAQAEAARRAADASEEAWRQQENAAREQAKRLLSEARAAGATATEQRLAAAGADLDGRVAEAERRIADARGSAMGEVKAAAADAARSIVERVAGTAVGPDEARRAVESVFNG